MNSKRKGGAYERKIAKKLGKALYNNEDVFWRSAGSGNTNKSNQQGDIIAVEPEGKWLTDMYLIECKDYKNVTLLGATMKKWLDRYINEALNQNKHMLLVFKYLHKDYIATTKVINRPALIIFHNNMAIYVDTLDNWLQKYKN